MTDSRPKTSRPSSHAGTLGRLFDVLFSIASGLLASPRQSRVHTSDLLALHSAEYQALMGRLSSWAVFQYSQYPLLFGGFAFVFDHRDSLPASLLPWLLASVVPVSYVVQLGALLDALRCTAEIEERLRPQVAKLVGHSEFWSSEASARRAAANSEYGYYWPLIITFGAVLGAASYAFPSSSLSLLSAFGFTFTLMLTFVVIALTREIVRYARRIDAAIQVHKPLSHSRQPTDR